MKNTSTILIVDDQESSRQVLRGLLLNEGYNLAFAANGEEALSQAAELLPDLILLDIMMPGMNGFEVCQKLRLDPQLSEILIIMVTALDDKRSRLRGIEVGADDFVNKPVDAAELKARVKTITRLNRHRRLRSLELQAERDRTRAILEALGEAVVVTDIDGYIQYLNPAAVSLTGFSAKEALGQNWRVWQTEETQTRLKTQILTTLFAGETWFGEVINQRKDGSTYDAALTIAPLFAPVNRTEPAIVGFVSVQRDITPLKQAERSKNEFVSNVSHELRTPLSVITLLSDNLDGLYDRLDDAKRRKMIRDIQKHTESLNNLIGDVLEISRIDSGRIAMDREVLNLTHLAREQVEEILPLVHQKGQSIRVIGKKQLNVLGNQAQLQQIVRNLLNNAIKYTPEGGQITCTCASLSLPNPATNPEFHHQWPGCFELNPGKWATLRVIDNGAGINTDHVPYVFDRFYRAKAQQNIRGTGLGLSISRDLVKLHGGHIAVASELGQGSVFAIYLPLIQRKVDELSGERVD
ncbi:MAG: response regulator [Anaerolineaceae bacterium]|nr:response regulator [Anaerolineaceae bacterium]MCB9102277.1 response regulator [Anaerolineales bacterium]